MARGLVIFTKLNFVKLHNSYFIILDSMSHFLYNGEYEEHIQYEKI